MFELQIPCGYGAPTQPADYAAFQRFHFWSHLTSTVRHPTLMLLYSSSKTTADQLLFSCTPHSFLYFYPYWFQTNPSRSHNLNFWQVLTGLLSCKKNRKSFLFNIILYLFHILWLNFIIFIINLTILSFNDWNYSLFRQ